MSPHEIIALVMAGVGCVFTLLGAIGVFRMPDVFMRMSTSAKASTLGVTSLVLASAVYHAELSLTVRALFVVCFVFMTVPVASHLIGRAAYVSGAKLWARTGEDALKGKYDRTRRTLMGAGGQETGPHKSSELPEQQHGGCK
jgi:multicomponent Na+:H+ antiporter subunit G